MQSAGNAHERQVKDIFIAVDVAHVPVLLPRVRGVAAQVRDAHQRGGQHAQTFHGAVQASQFQPERLAPHHHVAHGQTDELAAMTVGVGAGDYRQLGHDLHAIAQLTKGQPRDAGLQNLDGAKHGAVVQHVAVGRGTGRRGRQRAFRSGGRAVGRCHPVEQAFHEIHGPNHAPARPVLSMTMRHPAALGGIQRHVVRRPGYRRPPIRAGACIPSRPSSWPPTRSRRRPNGSTAMRRRSCVSWPCTPARRPACPRRA